MTSNYGYIKILPGQLKLLTIVSAHLRNILVFIISCRSCINDCKIIMNCVHKYADTGRDYYGHELLGLFSLGLHPQSRPASGQIYGQ